MGGFVMYAMTDETGRIGAVTEFEEYAEGMQNFDFSENFDFDKINEYRIENGELIHDPLPEPKENQIAELKRKLAETDYVVIKLAESLETGVSLLSNEENRYMDIIAQRREWRAKINDLEGE